MISRAIAISNSLQGRIRDSFNNIRVDINLQSFGQLFTSFDTSGPSPVISNFGHEQIVRPFEIEDAKG